MIAGRAAMFVAAATVASAAASLQESPAHPEPAAPPAPDSPRNARQEPADPPASTEWHGEPVLERRVGRNVVVLNHADATLECATIVLLLQRQYDWLAGYVGISPRWVIVHVGANYPLGFMIRNGPDPEMFLQANGIFDTANNYAHEMMHCFMSEFGRDIPHWFNESLSDMAYIDAEIELWERRREEPWLATFDRIDYRSYELLVLRRKYGPEFFRKVCAALVARREECLRVFSADTKLDVKNGLIFEALTAAAGEDVAPLMRELGLNPRTRERQRGY